VLDPFQLPFVQRGLVEVLILAVPAGLLGSLIVLRGLAFYSHATGTAAFPGLVLADGLGFAAPLGAFGAAATFSAAATALPRRKLGYDSLTALILVGCLAAGVILASDVFRSGSQIESLLFGSLLLIDGGDIALATAVAAISLPAMLVFGPRWVAAGFDPVAARSIGASSPHLEIALLGLIALAAVAALTAVGALLVTALFVVPAATARLWTDRLWRWQIGAVLLAAAEGTVGLWLSVKTDAPPGATIAVLSGAVFALATIARSARPLLGRRLSAGAVLAAITILAGCGGSDRGGGNGPKVVATTSQIADFVHQVGGDAVEVDQVLEPNVDAHDYEPRPSDVEGAADAELVFANGHGLDAWIEDLVSDSGSDARVVDLGSVLPVSVAGESGEHASEEAESHEHESESDPHWWHDPRNAEAAVAEIARSLTAADPGNRRSYRRRAAAFEKKLQALDRGIHRCMAQVPAGDRKLVSDHEAFGYFTRRYGIEFVGAVIPSQTTQAQPSAKDVANLTRLIEREGVKAIFPESSVSPKLARAIASQTGASSDYTLYGDSLGAPGSEGGTYLTMEEANADAMARGFTDGRRGCRIAEIR
jgi:ABC-type Zn uptake system ZnuABC Zn-binding protein ZnuA/ABC-type Mn2+/Zn2+ transport system permease subunit